MVGGTWPQCTVETGGGQIFLHTIVVSTCWRCLLMAKDWTLQTSLDLPLICHWMYWARCNKPVWSSSTICNTACSPHRWDPDILVGYEIQMKSWGYLLHRAAHLNIDMATQLARVAGRTGNTCTVSPSIVTHIHVSVTPTSCYSSVLSRVQRDSFLLGEGWVWSWPHIRDTHSWQGGTQPVATPQTWSKCGFRTSSLSVVTFLNASLYIV